MTGQELSRWADAAMYRSEVMPEAARRGPVVTLLNATPDPLGTLAATCAMYEGRVVRSLSEVTDDQRRQAFADMLATELQGPLEVAQFSFLVEGVTRSFTHQMVRERMAFFAQESLRFAVKDEGSLEEEVSDLPGYTPGSYEGNTWATAIGVIDACYTKLINAGVPAEDARGLLPHATKTRLHWVVDLRGLLHVAGLRLCTQAQFEWRAVMAQVVLALRGYHSGRVLRMTPMLEPYEDDEYADHWQFEAIADALRPVCYQKGRCGFMAKFDRDCTIRERVEANARAGRPSSEWGADKEVTRCGADSDCPGGCEMEETVTLIKAIQPSEWAADPTAARRRT